jgi:ComF family protein
VPVCPACLSAPQPLAAEYFCVSCRTPFQNHFPLDADGRCALCRSGLRGFDWAYCFGAYEGTLRQLIHLYKYDRMRPLARPLGNLLSAALPRDQRFDGVVAVPLHWRRKWERGFNQSDLLARSIARRCGVPLLHPVRRRRATRVQAGLSNNRRRENVAGAFIARAGAVRGLRILLVDDVMTTGATASACAQALKRAGAQSVALLTLARVDRRFALPEKIANSKGASAWPA